jgi:teichuronic acid biosynthesis glycosyltransferase TuaC
MRVLLFSTLYPSSERPGHGVFVETRLRELLAEAQASGRPLQAKVIAPVPWFYSKDRKHGDFAAMARTPLREQRNGVDVLHPRYLVVPKIGMSVAPWLLARAGLQAARQLQQEGFDFDVIDAHYFYPDGVTAALMARQLRKPFAVTARGSDINLIAQYTAPRRMMQWAAQRASACIGVSQALVNAMAALGMPAQRLHVLRNGVDLQRFHPWPQASARSAIGLDGVPLLLSVGNLVPGKGHSFCIDALVDLLPKQPGAQLVIIGAGPEKESLLRHAQNCGVAARVHLVGTVANAELAKWYSAADVLMLASSREGWPNVLLEAMACGTPAVATQVGGIPEIICDENAGRMVAQRSGAALADAVRQVLALDGSGRSGSERAAVLAATRAHAERFSWAQTSQKQLVLFAQMRAPRESQAIEHA